MSLEQPPTESERRELSQLVGLPANAQFSPAPPKRFLYPAILLLLAESNTHGYHLVGELNALGLTRLNRPSVYRALGVLEDDGLIEHHEEAPTAGSPRHVYRLTEAGFEVLDEWMSVIVKERGDLDLVLKRYWDFNAAKVVTFDPVDLDPSGAAISGTGFETPDAEQWRERFQIDRERSRLIVEIRTNIGPIAFSTNKLDGHIEAQICGGEIRGDSLPDAKVELLIEDLSSGNPIYDRELCRRIDAHKFPRVVLQLMQSQRIGNGNCYLVVGELTLHGVSVEISGKVTAILSGGSSSGANSHRFRVRRLCITGEQAIDIRSFNLQPPQMPIFKFYPDVNLSLQLEAQAESEPSR